MVDLRIVISQNEKSFQKSLEPGQALGLYGLKVGATFEGSKIGLAGYELKITGGTDKDGFPMKHDLNIDGKKKLLLSKGVGLRSTIAGFRKKKTVHGSIVGDSIAQLNVKVIKAGSETLEKLMGGETAGDEKSKE